MHGLSWYKVTGNSRQLPYPRHCLIQLQTPVPRYLSPCNRHHARESRRERNAEQQNLPSTNLPPSPAASEPSSLSHPHHSEASGDKVGGMAGLPSTARSTERRRCRDWLVPGEANLTLPCCAFICSCGALEGTSVPGARSTYCESLFFLSCPLGIRGWVDGGVGWVGVVLLDGSGF